MCERKEWDEFQANLVSEIDAWFRQLTPGDDRALLIVASARLGDLLKRLLQATMIHNPGGNDGLFDPDRPLGTFSSRILLAYRLGLLDRDFESFLQTLRKLRNDAAHSAQPIALQSAPHIDRVMHLQSLASKSPLWSALPESGPTNPKENPSLSLFTSLLMAVINAEISVLSATPFEIDNACTFQAVHPPAQT